MPEGGSQSRLGAAQGPDAAVAGRSDGAAARQDGEDQDATPISSRRCRRWGDRPSSRGRRSLFRYRRNSCLTASLFHLGRCAMVTRSVRRILGLIFVIGAGLVAGVSGQTQRQPAPASLDDLLAEVRAIRTELQQVSGASIRAQLMVGRLQLQEQRINSILQQLNTNRNQLNEVERTRALLAPQMKMFEEAARNEGVTEAGGPSGNPLRAMFEEQRKREKDLRAEEIGVVGAARDRAGSLGRVQRSARRDRAGAPKAAASLSAWGMIGRGGCPSDRGRVAIRRSSRSIKRRSSTSSAPTASGPRFHGGAAPSWAAPS